MCRLGGLSFVTLLFFCSEITLQTHKVGLVLRANKPEEATLLPQVFDFFHSHESSVFSSSTLEPVYFTANSSEQEIQAYDTMISNPSIDFIFGPSDFDSVDAFRRIASKNTSKVLIINTVASEDAFDQRNLFSIYPSTSYYLQPVFGLLSRVKARNVTVWSTSSTDSQVSSICSNLAALAETFTFTSTTIVSDDFAQIDVISASKTAALFLCASTNVTFAVLREMKKRNYFPPAMVVPFLPPVETLTDEERSLLLFVVSLIEFTDVKNKDLFGFDNMTHFLREWQASHNSSFPATAAPFGSALQVIESAIQTQEEEIESLLQQNQTRNLTEMIFTFSRVTSVTLTYEILFDSRGINIGGETVVVQLVPDYNRNENNFYRINYPYVNFAHIAPPEMSNSTLVYPAPNWNERAFNPKWWGEGSEIGIGVAAAIILFLLLLLLGFVIAFRGHQVMVAASPWFCGLYILGGCLLVSSVFTWMLFTNDSACQARPWLIGLGFTLMLSNILVKNVKVYILFSGQRIKAVKSEESIKLIVAVIIITLLQAIILIVWSGDGPLKAKFVIEDTWRAANNHFECRSPDTEAYVFTSLAYNALMLLLCVYLTWRTRNVEFVLFNESKFISFSLYNSILFSILVFALEASKATGRNTLFILRSILLLVGVFVSVMTIFIPKIIYVFNGLTLEAASSSTTAHSTTSGTTAGTFNTQMNRDEDDIQALKRQVAEMQSRLAALQKK